MDTIERPIKKGDYVHKKNFDRIGKTICVLVQSVSFKDTEKESRIHINGFCGTFLDKVQVVSEEEAKRINDLYASCVISPNENPEIDSCIRIDNGQPKNKLPNEHLAKIKLFTMSMKYPENNFQAYKCVHCEAYHIGKIKEQTVASI